ncbi:MAG: hypothetical protein ACJ760_06580 [Thermoleophilaceae bacterium]
MKVLVSPPVFALGRFIVGGASWAAPRWATSLMGLKVKAPAGSYWARLFGIRDIALGAGLVLSEPGEDRRRWRLLGIASDAADAVAGELAAREAKAKGASRWLLPGFAAAAAALGIAGLLTDE